MPMFGKKKKDDELEAAALEEGDDEGLFMPQIPRGPDETDVDLDEAAPVKLRPVTTAEAEAGVEVDDSPETPETPATQKEPEPDESSSDDPLSLFRAAQVEDDEGNIAKEIEDVPIDEVLSDARELRALLSAAGAIPEDAG